MTLLPPPQVVPDGKKNISGVWTVTSDDMVLMFTSLRPDATVYKAYSLPVLTERPTRIAIDPFLRTIRLNIGSTRPVEYRLDGKEKGFLRLTNDPGKGTLRCISRSYSEVSLLIDLTGVEITLHFRLSDDGEHLSITGEVEGTTHTVECRRAEHAKDIFDARLSDEQRYKSSEREPSHNRNRLPSLPTVFSFGSRTQSMKGLWGCCSGCGRVDQPRVARNICH